MWKWIKWKLKIGWDYTGIHIDQERVGSPAFYHIRLIETRYYTNNKTGETKATVRTYWA